jgi:hypothetical protein
VAVLLAWKVEHRRNGNCHDALDNILTTNLFIEVATGYRIPATCRELRAMICSRFLISPNSSLESTAYQNAREYEYYHAFPSAET